MIDEMDVTNDDFWKTGKMEHPFGRGINFQFDVKRIDPIVNALKRHNCPLRMPPKENWYRKNKMLLGNREFMVMDPDGYLLRFSENIGSKPVKKD